ncbi:hypothetical protein FACS1894204_02490 [Synergistales bacterium]|nr:hypothetical protein FACS1894204_02490 [Synergistales bacterium]
MTKEEAIITIHNCALLYSNNLSRKNVLFISKSNDKSMYFEPLFMPENFLHLTGVKIEKKFEKKLKSLSFFQHAFGNRLNPEQIYFAANGTTEMKLSILPKLMNIHQTARMVGRYNNPNTGSVLVSDKIAGTITFAMGFRYEDGVYVPNTALRENVKNLTDNSQQVLAIFVKPKDKEKYTQLSYIAKNTSIDSPILRKIVDEKTDLRHLWASFDIPRLNTEEPRHSKFPINPT